MTEQEKRDLQNEFHKASDRATDVLTIALCKTFKEITGAQASDRLRDKIFDALQLEH